MGMPPGINLTIDQAISRLREFIGDRPENNKLIPGYELSDDKLRLAIELSLDEFNNTPPFMSFTLKDFPSLKVLLHGSTIQCLIMAGLIQSRNYLQFSDGGISEVISDKAPSYQGWVQQMSGMLKNYAQVTDEIKIAINMESAFGVIPSPYGSWYNGGW